MHISGQSKHMRIWMILLVLLLFSAPAEALTEVIKLTAGIAAGNLCVRDVNINGDMITEDACYDDNQKGSATVKAVGPIDLIFNRIPRPQILSDNAFNKNWEPKIHNGQVVWVGSNHQYHTQIFFWDGHQRYQLTNTESWKGNPGIHRGEVVWGEETAAGGSIFFWDGNDAVQISDPDYDNGLAMINNGQVVWIGNDGYDREIFFWDGISTTQLTDDEYTSESQWLHNGQVVWENFDGTDDDIFFWDGTNITQLTDNNFNDREPQVHNAKVVWSGYDGQDTEIFFWNGSVTHQLTDNSYMDKVPQIHNGKVTWVGNTDVSDTDIFLWEGSGIINISNTVYPDFGPRIHDGQVVWYALDEPGYEVFFWDGNTTYQLSDNDYYDREPEIHDGLIVWGRSDGSNKSQILLFDPGAHVVDNFDEEFSSQPGLWVQSSFVEGGYDSAYSYAPPGDGNAWAKWAFSLGISGTFEVFAHWTSHPNRSNAAPFTINNHGKEWIVTVDQTANGGQFVSLGTFKLAAGDVDVVLNDTPDGYVIADAVKLVYKGKRICNRKCLRDCIRGCCKSCILEKD